MLTGLSTLFGRSLRHKRPLVFVRVSGVGMAAAAVQEFEAAKLPFVLVFRPEFSSRSDFFVLHALKEAVLTSHQSGALAVEAEAEFYRTMEMRGLSAVITDSLSNELETVVRLKTLPSVEAFGQYRAAAGVILPPGTAASEVKELSREGVPLVAYADGASTAALRSCLAAGASGIILEDELQKAYSAGLRTALRDRERWDPYQYEAAAMRAASHSLKNRIHSFYP